MSMRVRSRRSMCLLFGKSFCLRSNSRLRLARNIGQNGFSVRFLFESLIWSSVVLFLTSRVVILFCHLILLMLLLLILLLLLLLLLLGLSFSMIYFQTDGQVLDARIPRKLRRRRAFAQTKGGGGLDLLLLHLLLRGRRRGRRREERSDAIEEKAF